MSQAKLYTVKETYIYFQNWYYSGMNKLLPQTNHTLFYYIINYIPTYLPYTYAIFIFKKKKIKLMFLSTYCNNNNLILIVCNGLKVTHRVKRLKMSYIFTMKSNRMMAFLFILPILVQVIPFIAMVLYYTLT